MIIIWQRKQNVWIWYIVLVLFIYIYIYIVSNLFPVSVAIGIL